MIALLSGQLAQRNPEQIIIDVNGVGYRLQIPLSTFYTLPEQGSVKLRVYTQVKEDGINLYGFASQEEKDLFSLLISVSGVGPKLAITTLSHMPATELAQALSEGDSSRLTAIPGIGKKSADRLVLELRDKATAYAMSASIAVASEPQSTTDNHPLEDALSALINLGYKENLARRALKTLNLPSGTALEDILKAALQLLVR
jgi:Holliday junction DNA helicase RuvA